MIKRFFIYGSAGISLEIFWTGIWSLFYGDVTLTGHSSLIMFPIYGSAVFMEPCFLQLNSENMFLRGSIYMSLIFAAEYFSGIFLNIFNICPWSYSDALYNIRGVIRLDFMPLWFSVGLFYEKLYKILTTG